MYVNIAEFKISDWRTKVNDHLVLRVIPNDSFVAEDGLDGDFIAAGGEIYGQVPVVVQDETVNGYTSPTLTIPEVTIHSTTDARINPLATYRAEIWSTKLNKRISILPMLEAFRVPYSATTMTWTDIIQFNTPISLGTTRTVDEEIKMIINTRFDSIMASVIGGTPGRFSIFSTPGDGVTDSDYSQLTSALAPISTDAKDLGTSTLRFRNVYSASVLTDAVTIDGILTASSGLITGNLNVGGALGVTGNISGAAITGTSLSVTGAASALNGSVGQYLSIASAREGSENGLFSSRALVWDGSSLTNTFARLDRNGSVPLATFHSLNPGVDALSASRDAGTDDGAYIIRASDPTFGEAGVDALVQFKRTMQGVNSIPVQTMNRVKLNQVTAGGGVEDAVAFYAIPNNHPSAHSGEKYSFRVLGDLTGTTSSHILKIDIGGDQPATLTIPSATNVSWEAEGSITMLNINTGDYVVEGKITLSNGTVVRGSIFGTGLTALDGVGMFVLATDSGTGQTRARFIEVFHEDWTA